MTNPLVVFACGNESRGDDALGLRLLERVTAQSLPGVVTVEDFQFQIEHALDLDKAALALFLDAGTGSVPPVAFYEIPAGARSASASSHALEPAQLLEIYRQAMGKPPPPAFVLCVRGERFGLGEGMSDVATQRLERAWVLLRDLCSDPDMNKWRLAAAEFDPGDA